MNPVKESIQRMSGYLEHGEIKSLAEKFRMPEHRAKSLLSGALKVTEADYALIDEVYALTLPRKKKLDKLDAFAPALTAEEISIMRELIGGLKGELKK